MEKINWDVVTYFKQGEFPEDPDKYADPELIYTLNNFRKVLGKRVFPSPVSGSLARYKTGSQTSQHYADDVKKSRADDFFAEGRPIDILFTMMGFFNGIGVYLDGTGPDGKPWVRFHGDIRKYGYAPGVPLIWIVNEKENKKTGNMYYPQVNPDSWELLKDERLYKHKIYGRD